MVLAFVVWMNRYWSEKQVVDKFFAALQNRDYETAYGIYFADRQWKEHPEKYSSTRTAVLSRLGPGRAVGHHQQL